MFPRRREEKERMCWEGEGGAEGMNADGHGTGEPGHPNTRSCGVKGSSVRVTQAPALFRPETGSWNHRRFAGPARWASSRFQPRPMRGEKMEAERKGERQRGEEKERMIARCRSSEKLNSYF